MRVNENSDPRRTLVFIPTFNDVALLPAIVEEILALDGDYVPLVIDDGSSPRLLSSDLPKGSLLFSLPTNMGLGMCTHIALDHALKHGYDELLRIDADGQHPVAMAPDLLSPIREGSADLVVGTRENHSDGAGMGNSLRKLVKLYFSTIASAITRGGVPKDVNSGFIALNQTAIVAISDIILERFPEPQMFIIAHAIGLRISEVAVTQNPRHHGKTTLSVTHAARLIYRFSVFAAGEILPFRR
jgi:glycosyltransferase involved in cell wall biosynthesis